MLNDRDRQNSSGHSTNDLQKSKCMSALDKGTRGYVSGTDHYDLYVQHREAEHVSKRMEDPFSFAAATVIHLFDNEWRFRLFCPICYKNE